MRTCNQKGCKKKHKGLGLCSKHYQEFKKYGFIRERNDRTNNEIIIFCERAEILLYDKHQKECARCQIDILDVDIVKNHKWRLTHKEKYCATTINGKTVFIHQLIMNPTDGLVVDHKNHDVLNNRRYNLRLCTRQQNGFNHKISSRNKSGFSGVSFYKRTKKWQVRIKFSRKEIHLGYFKTKEEAIKVRKKAEIKYFGEFRNKSNE